VADKKIGIVVCTNRVGCIQLRTGRKLTGDRLTDSNISQDKITEGSGEQEDRGEK
jgi:hypothetical protein